MKRYLALFCVFLLIFTLALFALDPPSAIKNELKAAEVLTTETMAFDTSEPVYYLSSLSMKEEIGTYLGTRLQTGSVDEAYLSGDDEITYPGLGVYKGEHEELVRQGKGTFTWEDGNVYTGNWKNDEISGYGELTYPEIGTYKGNYSNSMRSGEGTFTWEIGDSYTGGWREDKMSGDGTYVFADGVTIKGIFANNYLSSGSYTYELPANQYGLYHHDKIVSWSCYINNGLAGDITFKCKGGITYSGALSTLTGTGKAKITYSDGSVYEGQVNKCVRSGSGKMTWYSSSTGGVKAVYDGNWSNDTMSGQGKYYFSASSYPYLTGTFKDGKPDGTCVYYKAAGNTFDTIWKNGICTEVKET